MMHGRKNIKENCAFIDPVLTQSAVRNLVSCELLYYRTLFKP